MVFSSIGFLLYFLPAFFVLYGMTPPKYKNAALLAGSLVFYTLGEPKYLILLMASVLANYFIGLHLGVEGKKNKKHKNKEGKLYKKKRILLYAAVIGNIGMLAWFKLAQGESALPLGISFYTFQILSYLLDVYRGEICREDSFVDFAAYIVMFPQLVSGPIVRYGEVQPGLKGRSFSVQGVQDGLKLFTLGLASKVLLADRVGLLWRDAQITGFESISQAYAWLAAFAYSMKIYFDFQGYSLMAAGLGRMLGFELPENFRTPYMARSVRDFYRRWHITLGRWFGKYVYIPLGGNRKGEFRTICNLFLVWLLTSVWHGVTPNFLLWGGILWLLSVLERQWEKTGIGRNWKILPHLYLWLVIPVTWVCFAIVDLNELMVFLGRMFGLAAGIHVRSSDWLGALQDYWGLLGIGMMACTPLVQKLYQRMKDTAVGILLLAALFWVCVWRISVEGNNPFMYRNF